MNSVCLRSLLRVVFLHVWLNNGTGNAGPGAFNARNRFGLFILYFLFCIFIYFDYFHIFILLSLHVRTCFCYFHAYHIFIILHSSQFVVVFSDFVQRKQHTNHHQCDHRCQAGGCDTLRFVSGAPTLAGDIHEHYYQARLCDTTVPCVARVSALAG
jgi:hypothetical protein